MLETGDHTPNLPSTTLSVQGPAPPSCGKGSSAPEAPALKGSNLKLEEVDPNPYGSFSREGFQVTQCYTGNGGSGAMDREGDPFPP